MLFVFEVVSKIFLQYMGNVLHCTYCKVEDVIISNNKKKIRNSQAIEIISGEKNGRSASM
jgi:hypothetical protein